LHFETSSIQSTIAKLKANRGATGFIGLQTSFKIMDWSKSLNFNEFKKAIKENQVSMTDSELKQLFDSTRTAALTSRNSFKLCESR
jgi:hypothetical protein